jgi:glucose-6-phosphate isomerase
MEFSYSSPPVLNEDLENEFNSTIHRPDVGFYHLAREKVHVSDSLKVFNKFKNRKNFVLAGIGGSSLGAEMLVNALHHDRNRCFYYINNIDPDHTAKILERVTPKDTVFYIVSKSGSTAETLAAVAILFNWLGKKRIPPKKFKDYLVFCTDPHKGELLNLGIKLGIPLLTVPVNVGGRYCVLSSAGILPLFFAGGKPKALLKGAVGDFKSDLQKTGNFLKEHLKRGFNETVMMPYSSLLKSFSDWFVQLWAESLGKEGKGLTPISSYGATDQHSQMQLFMEGPLNKVLIFLEIKKFKNDFPLKNKEEGGNFKRLSHFKLSELLEAELAGTLKALSDAKRPWVKISLERLDEENLGRLILFFESLTVWMALSLKIDPFNQPGVEAGKKNSYLYLDKLR